MNQVRGFRLLALTSIVGFGFVAGVLHAAPDKKPVEKKADAPKYTVEEVMAKIHKGKEKSVFAVILNNKGTADDKAKLVDYYTALAASEAPKGDKADWSKRTAAMLSAAVVERLTMAVAMEPVGPVTLDGQPRPVELYALVET